MASKATDVSECGERRMWWSRRARTDLYARLYFIRVGRVLSLAAGACTWRVHAV